MNKYMTSKRKSATCCIIIWIIALIILIFIGIPLLIHRMFSTPAPIAFMAVDWTAKEYLAYFGSALGGIGTISLGIITIIQTRALKDEAVDRESANVKRPFFTISEIISTPKDASKWGHGNHGYILRYKADNWSFIKVSNIGDGIANNLVIEPWGNQDTPKNDIPCFSTPQNGFITIPVMIKAVERTQYVTIYYENLIGYAYSQKIEIVITNSLNYKGILLTEEGKEYEATKEEYIATIYNIYPQQPLGMGKYNRESGKYIVEQ